MSKLTKIEAIRPLKNGYYSILCTINKAYFIFLLILKLT